MVAADLYHVDVMTADGYWFKSSRFDIEPGEDDEINPGIYGRQLARWLKERLEERGYTVEQIINEDWGRCLMCSRDPFLLWVGCASVTDDEHASNDAEGEAAPPAKEHIVWHCFAAAEASFLKRWFSKVDAKTTMAKLHRELGEILGAESTISLVPEP